MIELIRCKDYGFGDLQHLLPCYCFESGAVATVGAVSIFRDPSVFALYATAASLPLVSQCNHSQVGPLPPECPTRQ